MRRYIDFRGDDWPDRTDSKMQALRWHACADGVGMEPPLAGVIDEYPEDLLYELAEEGWVALDAPMRGEPLREAARAAMLETLQDDLDCLGTQEHVLVERMLIGDGETTLETVPEMEAAYTLRMRLWCDLGLGEEEMPVARLDSVLLAKLPDLLLRAQHQERRARIFIFDGMLHGLLYMSGYLDDRLPCREFIKEVLRVEQTRQTERLARNFLEASCDTYSLVAANLLVHAALADPETLVPILSEQGAFQMPQVTPGVLSASMNGLLPEESAPDEALQRALYGALRPEYEPHEVASDLRLLAKQGAPLDSLQEIMASTLCVLPTSHMNGALREMRRRVPRWIHSGYRPQSSAGDDTLGRLH